MSPDRNAYEEKSPRISAWRGRSLVPDSCPREEIAKFQGPTCDLDFTRFPSTRYQGSKRKIIPWIWSHLYSLDFTSALDVCGGTASVSYLFKKMGKRVTYNDYLEFNHQIGLALIENDSVTLGQSDLDLAATPIRKHSDFVRRTFKNIYFTDAENRWIDMTVSRIRALKASPYKRALMYYGLFQSCLVKRPFNLFHRRNLYVRFGKMARQFGNKTTWDRAFDDVFPAFCTEANAFVFKGERRCSAICHEALEIPRRSYDLVYIDPPYLRKDRWNDNYLSYYHFLEGLCRYDDWHALIDYGTINLRMKASRPNIWADGNRRVEALDALFETFKDSTLVISYKRFGVPSIDTLVKMLKRHGRKVRSFSRHYKYALNHQNGEAHLNREVLLVGERSN
jgi:adenine-specific DNA methylase